MMTGSGPCCGVKNVILYDVVRFGAVGRGKAF